MGRACFSWQRGAALKTPLLLDGFCAYANGNNSCAIGTLVPDQKNQQNYLWRKEFKELTVMKQKTGFLVYLVAVISSSLEKFQIPLKIHWSPDPWAQKCKELRTHSQADADWKCMKELGSPCRASAYYPVCRSTREIFRISFGSPFSLLQVTFILFVHLSRYSSMAYP